MWKADKEVNMKAVFTEMNTTTLCSHQQNDQLPVVSLAQLVEHCTGITNVMGLDPVQA